MRKIWIMLVQWLASWIDRFVERFIIHGLRQPRIGEPEVRVKHLSRVAEKMHQQNYVKAPQTFFAAPPNLDDVGLTRKYRGFFEGQYLIEDFSWNSQFEPLDPDFASEYRSHRANHTAYMRVFRDPTAGHPRPSVVLVHGYRRGERISDFWVWPRKQFMERGIDFGLVILPFHGPRGAGYIRRPMFPTADSSWTIEGFRQAVFDIRTGMKVFREPLGASQVSVMGVSLGGYTSGLLATVDPTLHALFLLNPPVSLTELWPGPPEVSQAMAEATSVVNPLARRPQIAADQVRVFAGQSDAIIPMHHARRMAAHFETDLQTYPGGHVLQYQARKAMAPELYILE